jgi:hypothetical protein
MPFTENFTDFINPDTPGYVVATILGETVPGVFDKTHQLSFDMNGTEPVLYVEEENISAAEQETLVVIGGVNYTIGNIEPDGSGLATLRLVEA